MNDFLVNYSFRLQKKIHKKISALDIAESLVKEIWSISHATCVDIIAQVSLTPSSIFLFLDVPTRKLGIIILPTDRAIRHNSPDCPYSNTV